MSIAKATIMGRLTADPRKNDKVDGLIHISVAHNKKIKDQETVTFIDVDCWGEAGAFVAKHYKKGDGIYLEAEIGQDNWEDENGKKRSKYKFKLLPYSTAFPPASKPTSAEEF